MESECFDALAARLAAPCSRRRSLALLTVPGVASALSTGDDAAGKGKGKKKRN